MLIGLFGGYYYMISPLANKARRLRNNIAIYAKGNYPSMYNTMATQMRVQPHSN